jgi:hypothetical protein
LKKKQSPTPEELETLDEFWENFFSVYNTKVKEGKIQEIDTKEHRYAVFQLLCLYKEKIKKNPLEKEELLHELEIQIERSSMMFDATSKQRPIRHVYGAVNMSNRPLPPPPLVSFWNRTRGGAAPPPARSGRRPARPGHQG